MKNKTTNEHLRYRWNGAPENTERVMIYQNRASCCSLLREFLWSPMPKSKLDTLCTLMNAYSQIGNSYMMTMP